MLQGESAQRVGPLDVVETDQHRHAAGSGLDHLGQALHQPDPLIVMACQIGEGVTGQQGPVTVQDAGRQ
ncbi:hypothetical protein SGLAM104S_09728 [Streptomyces glaucescens]